MLLFFFIVIFFELCYSQEFNTNLLHNYNFEVNANDVWGYTSLNGDEYAIVGLQNGTSIIKVSNDSIEQVGFIPGEISTWRDI